MQQVHSSEPSDWSEKCSSPAGNSLNRAVHALLIATPTVKATRELVSERSYSPSFLCITLKGTLFRKCKWCKKQNLKLVSSAKAYLSLLLVKQPQSRLTRLPPRTMVTNNDASCLQNPFIHKCEMLPYRSQKHLSVNHYKSYTALHTVH